MFYEGLITTFKKDRSNLKNHDILRNQTHILIDSINKG